MITYEIVDPRDGHTRYIGKTTKGIDARLKRHLWEHDKSGGDLYKWIKAVIADGLIPIIAKVADGDCERELIQWYVANGGKLTNYQHTRALAGVEMPEMAQ